jgi:hypothetical protein
LITSISLAETLSLIASKSIGKAIQGDVGALGKLVAVPESTVEDSERDKILGPWPAELTPKMFFLFSLPGRRPVKMHKKISDQERNMFPKGRALVQLSSGNRRPCH